MFADQLQLGTVAHQLRFGTELGPQLLNFATGLGKIFRQFLFPSEGGVKAQTLLFITECYRFNSTFRKAL